MPVDRDYFARLYGRNEDPWGIGTRWYEARKRALLLATLPRERFARAFEPGCGGGHLSIELAPRCDQLVAMELADAAAEQARQRLAAFPQAQVLTGELPQHWPAGTFDLMVFSELGYYFPKSDWNEVAAQAAAALADDGVIVACHFRHPFAEQQITAQAVHDALGKQPGLFHHVHHEEPDFMLDLWSRREDGRLA
ncbi:methyltransferase domain-containing protein [Cupriavidus necator]|uniref:methyltransferase domain-containing protein n=1 Tax=Cupriavidus necator TaxID=106590 RepID=UPI00339D722B